MRFFVTTILALVSSSAYSQLGSYTDPRDGNTYQTITIGNKTWLRENLRLKTSLSYFPNQNKDLTDLKLGNYYLMSELNSVCPTGWHVATVKELKEYIYWFAAINKVVDTSVTTSTSKDKDSSRIYNIPGVNPKNDTALQLTSIGWVEGNKRNTDKSITIWLKDTEENDDKFHAHIGTLGYIIHTHTHNIIDKPKKVRKFAVRCVCEK